MLLSKYIQIVQLFRLKRNRVKNHKASKLVTSFPAFPPEITWKLKFPLFWGVGDPLPGKARKVTKIIKYKKKEERKSLSIVTFY